MPPAAATAAAWMLDQEARAIQDRLRRVPAFAVSETMVMAAMPSPVAQAAIDRFLQHEGTELRREIDAVSLVAARRRRRSPPRCSGASRSCGCASTWRSGNFDLFSDALTQRSETDGVLLSGLDVGRVGRPARRRAGRSRTRR